jgi:O-antigen/teichoic acid export membrane protein
MFPVRRETPHFLQTLPLYVLASVITSGVRLATLAAAFRILTPDGFAQIDLFLYFALTTSALAICGQDSAALRFSSGMPGQSHAAHVPIAAVFVALGGQLALIAVLLTLRPALAPLTPSIEPTTIITCAVIHSIGWSLASIFGSELRASHRADLYLMASIIHLLCRSAALAIFFLPDGIDPNTSSFAVMIAGSQFVSGVAFAACARNRWSPGLPSRSLLISMAKYGLPLGGVVALGSAGPLLDRTVIVTVAGEAWLADYAFAALPVTVLMASVQVLNLAWTPAALTAHASGRFAFAQRSSLIGLGSAITMYLLLLFFAKPLMFALNAPHAQRSVALLPFVGLVFVLRFMSTFTAIGLIVERRMGAKLLISLYTLGLSTGMALLAGIKVGATAFPLGAFLGQFVGWIIETTYSNRVSPLTRQPLLLMASTIAVSAILALTMWLFTSQGALHGGS